VGRDGARASWNVRGVRNTSGPESSSLAGGQSTRGARIHATSAAPAGEAAFFLYGGCQGEVEGGPRDMAMPFHVCFPYSGERRAYVMNGIKAGVFPMLYALKR
jgi:hypothetical protein